MCHAVDRCGDMLWSTRKTWLSALGVAVAGGVTATAVLIATSGGPAPVAIRPAATPSPSPFPSPTHTRLHSPFTGEPVKSLHRVLIVKIGNTVPERPATGLSYADIVYLIPVEGGLSRIMAVFSSHYPSVIGPVRSTREDDIALLRQYGRPAFGYSGATRALLPHIHRARIVDLFDGRARGYFRGGNRPIPYNLYAHTRTLLAQARHASKAHSIRFRFGPPPAGGRHVRSVPVSYPAASFRFTWSAHKKRWLVSMDGAPARSTGSGRLGAATVVIQYTKVRKSRFLEYGVPPPYAESVGSGRALVLRNGKEYQALWSRHRWGVGTTFTTRSGKPMTFARGQVWIVLTAAGGHWPFG
jgi:Protein of unknown function (DUF3048) N-terminal domain/Protein of unknown function (DUF3048) C-terminal domain